MDNTWSINGYFRRWKISLRRDEINASFQIEFSLGKKSTLKFPVRAFFIFFFFYKNNSVRWSKILNLENIRNLTFYQSKKKFPGKILLEI